MYHRFSHRNGTSGGRGRVVCPIVTSVASRAFFGRKDNKSSYRLSKKDMAASLPPVRRMRSQVLIRQLSRH